MSNTSALTALSIQQAIPEIFWIPKQNLEALQNRVAKLNRKAARLGCEPLVIEIGTPKQRKVLQDYEDFDVEGRKVMKSRKVLCTVYPVVIAGSPPVLNGWALVATIQFLDGENIIRNLPGARCPEVYRTATDWCDHCRSARGRKDVFIVRHEGGEHKQVGRQCIADFLGHESAEMIARRAEWLATIRAYCMEAESWGGGNGEWTFELDEVVTASMAAIRVFGWFSGRAEDHEMGVFSTKTRVNRILFSRKDAVTVTTEDAEKAEAAIAWAEAIDPDHENDYLYNLGAISRHGAAGPRTMGLACSIAYSYLRELGQIEARRRQAEVSNWFGEVKKRADYTLTVTKVIDIDTIYGTASINIMVDASGNVAKWKSSSQRLIPGKTYAIRATVHDHTEYKGVKQTVLTRGKVKG